MMFCFSCFIFVCLFGFFFSLLWCLLKLSAIENWKSDRDIRPWVLRLYIWHHFVSSFFLNKGLFSICYLFHSVFWQLVKSFRVSGQALSQPLLALAGELHKKVRVKFLWGCVIYFQVVCNVIYRKRKGHIFFFRKSLF